MNGKNYKLLFCIDYGVKMTQKYVSLAFIREVRDTVEEMIRKEGGSIELDKLEFLLRQHYNYPIKGKVLTENEVNGNPQLISQKDNLLLYKSGIVYLN